MIMEICVDARPLYHRWVIVKKPACGFEGIRLDNETSGQEYLSSYSTEKICQCLYGPVDETYN